MDVMNPAPEQQHLQDLILLLDLKIEGLLDEIPYLQCYFPNHGAWPIFTGRTWGRAQAGGCSWGSRWHCGADGDKPRVGWGGGRLGTASRRHWERSSAATLLGNRLNYSKQNGKTTIH